MGGAQPGGTIPQQYGIVSRIFLLSQKRRENEKPDELTSLPSRRPLSFAPVSFCSSPTCTACLLTPTDSTLSLDTLVSSSRDSEFAALVLEEVR